jgi:hypothetical protein
MGYLRGQNGETAMRWLYGLILLLVVGVVKAECPDTFQTESNTSPGFDYIWDALEMVDPQPTLAGFVYEMTGPDEPYIPCCVTSNGWVWLVRPPIACETSGNVCRITSDHGLNFLLLSRYYDLDCDGDIDLRDFAAFLKENT